MTLNSWTGTITDDSKLENFCLACTTGINSEVKAAIKTCLECRNRITTYLMPWTNIQYKCYKQGDHLPFTNINILLQDQYIQHLLPIREILVLLLLPSSSTPCIRNSLVLIEVSNTAKLSEKMRRMNARSY